MTMRGQNVAGEIRPAAGSRLRWLALAPLLIGAALVASPSTNAAAEQVASSSSDRDTPSSSENNTSPPMGNVSSSRGSVDEPPRGHDGFVPSVCTHPTGPVSTAGSVIWTQRPTGRRRSEPYPRRPLPEGQSGRVQLACTVMPSLTLSCAVVSEAPTGLGFGRTALSASTAYRASPTLSDGTDAVGATTCIAVAFQAPSNGAEEGRVRDK